MQPLAGDGSNRRFHRVLRKNGERLCLAVVPSGSSKQDMAEARATRLIGLHLYDQGVRVPAQYGWDEETGLVLFEDLGDLKLHDLVERSRNQSGVLDWEVARPMYTQALQELAVMQIRGKERFDDNWCWDTPVYDRPLMLSRESGYFLRSFWQDLLGREVPPGIEEEFAQIATMAAEAPPVFFLHRDVQSRNIMVADHRICFIDFQGGRRGPLGYDPASLLIDPYAGLPLSRQEELLGVYLNAVAALHPLDEEEFRRHYGYLALQRNLQILGAFAFLSRVRGKLFFARYITPALLTLIERSGEREFSGLRVLPRMAKQGLLHFQTRV